MVFNMTPYMNCPSGSSFFACTRPTDTYKFIGCCTDPNPCNDGCGDGGVRPTSYDPTADNGQAYYDLKDQSCDECTSQTAKCFYNCNNSQPLPFWGCCNEAACDSGCPLNQLGIASLSGDAQSYAMFLYASDSSSSLRSSPTSSSSSSSSSSSTTSLGSLDKPSPKSSDIGEIVGGVLGGLALLVAILGLLFCVRRRKKEEITMVDPTDYQPVRYSKDPTLVSSDHLGSPHKSTYTNVSPDPSQRYSTIEPLTSSLGNSPYPSGGYTWGEQTNINHGQSSTEGHMPIVIAPLNGQGIPFEWASDRMIPTGYYIPQELGSTPIYPEMEAMTETGQNLGISNEEAPRRNIEDTQRS